MTLSFGGSKNFFFVLFSRHLLHRSFSFPYKEDASRRWFLQLFSFTKSIRNSLDQFHEIYSKVLNRELQDVFLTLNFKFCKVSIIIIDTLKVEILIETCLLMSDRVSGCQVCVCSNFSRIYWTHAHLISLMALNFVSIASV